MSDTPWKKFLNRGFSGSFLLRSSMKRTCNEPERMIKATFWWSAVQQAFPSSTISSKWKGIIKPSWIDNGLKAENKHTQKRTRTLQPCHFWHTMTGLHCNTFLTTCYRLHLQNNMQCTPTLWPLAIFRESYCHHTPRAKWWRDSVASSAYYLCKKMKSSMRYSL